MLYIIIPTLGKREMGLQKTLESIKEHTKGPYEVIISLSGDPKVATVKKFFSQKWNTKSVSVSSDKSEGGAVALKFALENGQVKPEDFVMFMADDTEIVQDGWDLKAKIIFDTLFPDHVGVIAFDDGIQDGKYATHPFTTYKTYGKYGVLQSGYHHYYWNKDLSVNAMLDGRYIYIPLLQIYHKHPCIGYPDDDVYQMNKKYFKSDEEIFYKRVWDRGFVMQDGNLRRVR